jgi:flagellin-specific chaperone FliS
MNPALLDSMHQYIRLQIETASQQRLVCLLHEHCTVTLQQALKTAEKQRRPLLDKVQNMLVILQRAIDIKDATSKTLFHLYDYCYCRLEHVSTTEISNALGIIDKLRHMFDYLRKHLR